jgi:hypothetical protein
LRDSVGPIAIQLDQQEIELLRSGLAEWGGPANATPELAVAMGFAGVEDLEVQARRLREALKDSIPLVAADWTRVLAATEVAFASNVLGSGLDWSSTVGLSDEATIRLLRKLQLKLGSAIARRD